MWPSHGLPEPKYIWVGVFFFFAQIKHLCGSRHSNKLREWSLQLFPTSAPLTEKEVQEVDDSSYQEQEDEEEES